MSAYFKEIPCYVSLLIIIFIDCSGGRQLLRD